MTWKTKSTVTSTVTLCGVTQRCTMTNPASFMSKEEGEPHECVAETMKYTRLRPDMESSSLLQADVMYFIDG